MSATVLRSACSSALSAKSTARSRSDRPFTSGRQSTAPPARCRGSPGTGPGSPIRGDARGPPPPGPSAIVTTPPGGPPPPAVDPVALLRSRAYVQLLVIAALLGVPISAIAYGFLVLSTRMQHWLYTDLPGGLGLAPVPTWWPVPLLVVGGLLVALVVRYFPGRGGE